MKSWYNVVVWIITFVLCCLHVSFITRQYLQYETTTKTTIKHEETIDIPVVVVCMTSDWVGNNVSDFLTYQHRDEKRTLHAFNMATSNCELEGICDTSTNAIFEAVGEDVSRLLSVTRFANGRNRCFAFRMRQRQVHVSFGGSYFVYELGFHRGEESPSDMTYYLVHPDRNLPLFESRHQLKVHYDRIKNIRLHTACLNYQRRETRLLESPYNTRCLNYRTRGLQSQLHCINDCIMRFASDRLNFIPDDVSIFHQNASNARFANENEKEKITTSLKLFSIRKSCNQMCSRKDCVHHSFQPYNDCKIRNGTYVWFAHYFLIVPNYPLILIETHVFNTFIDFLMMALNIISLWTAFSPIQMATDYAFIFTKRINDELHDGPREKILKLIYDRMFRFTIIVSCLLCCIWQLRESADEYFKYLTVSKVAIQFEDPISIPAVTLCTHLPTKQHNNRSFSLEFESIKNNRTYFINYDGPLEKRIVNESYCITVHPEISSKKIMDPQNSQLNTFGIRYLSKNGKLFICILHDAYSHMHGHYNSYEFLPLKQSHKQVLITYTKFTSKLLPAPYDSMCQDYRYTAFQSQHHCLETCAVTRLFQQNKSYPNILSALYEPFDMIYMYNPSARPPRHHQIYRVCRMKCPALDCVSNEYSPKHRRWDDSERNLTIETQLTLDSSQRPAFITKLYPAIDVVTFLSTFLGCIAFWTGIYPFTLLLSHQVLKHRIAASLPKGSKKLYITFIVTLAATAYSYELLTMANSYFKYATSNTIVLASDERIEIPAIDFCFPIQAENDTRTRTKSKDEMFVHVAGSKDLIKRSDKTAHVRIIYYVIFGMLCHSVRVESGSLPNVYADHGSYTDFNYLKGNDLIILTSANHVVGNFTLKEQMYLAMHSLSEFGHDDADNFLLIQHTFRFPQDIMFEIFPDVVTEYRMPVPYDTSCMEQEYQTVHSNIMRSSKQCFDSCYSHRFIQAHESFPSDSPQFVRVNEKLMRTTNATDSADNEKMKQTCHLRCRNDCHQVHYSCEYDQFWQSENNKHAFIVSFTVMRPQQEIVIRYSAHVSFMDLMFVILNGASFYLTFCPATLLLSKRFLSIFKKKKIRKNKKNRRNGPTRDSQRLGIEEPDLVTEEFRRRGIRIAWVR